MQLARTLVLVLIASLLLLTVGCSSGGNNTPLHTAAMYGDRAALESALASGAAINAKNGDNNTALHEAADKGNLVAVNFLIEHGADLNARDEDGDTPLHFAADDNQYEIVKALIKAGADVNAVNENMETPLFQAAEEGQAESVQALLAAPGIQPDLKDNKGISPAMSARSHGYIPVAEMIERKAASASPVPGPIAPAH